jgi:hypothetical protein
MILCETLCFQMAYGYTTCLPSGRSARTFFGPGPVPMQIMRGISRASPPLVPLS